MFRALDLFMYTYFNEIVKKTIQVKIYLLM